MNKNRRKSNGQFAKGNSGGPGRPTRSVESDYLAVLGDAVTPDRWRKIVERAISDAETGNYRAREWLGRYLIGEKTTVDILEKQSSTTDAIAVAAELRKDRNYVRFCRQKRRDKPIHA